MNVLFLPLTGTAENCHILEVNLLKRTLLSAVLRINTRYLLYTPRRKTIKFSRIKESLETRRRLHTEATTWQDLLNSSFVACDIFKGPNHATKTYERE